MQLGISELLAKKGCTRCVHEQCPSKSNLSVDANYPLYHESDKRARQIEDVEHLLKRDLHNTVSWT